MPVAMPVDIDRPRTPIGSWGVPTSDPYVQTLYLDFERSTTEEILRSSTWRSMQWQDEKFEALSRLQANWDGEESEAPNANAKRLTRLILAALSRGEVTPSAIEPSAESGVGIGFVKGRRRGSIEIFNTGEMIAATYEGREAPVVWEFNSEEESMTSTIGIIRVYMSA